MTRHSWVFPLAIGVFGRSIESSGIRSNPEIFPKGRHLDWIELRGVRCALEQNCLRRG